MTPRNPEESPDETTQDKVLQVPHEARKDEVNAQAKPVQRDEPVLVVHQEATSDTKVELDRVEIYLKGPTVFSA